MYVVCVRIQVVADRAEELVAATLENATATRTEPGNARFDVLWRIDDSSRSMLYEVYASQRELHQHQETAHYLRWKERVAALMAAPRVAEKRVSLFPEPWV